MVYVIEIHSFTLWSLICVLPSSLPSSTYVLTCFLSIFLLYIYISKKYNTCFLFQVCNIFKRKMRMSTDVQVCNISLVFKFNIPPMWLSVQRLLHLARMLRWQGQRQPAEIIFVQRKHKHTFGFIYLRVSFAESDIVPKIPTRWWSRRRYLHLLARVVEKKYTGAWVYKWSFFVA